MNARVGPQTDHWIDVEKGRLALILSVERIALCARYIVYVALLILFYLDYLHGTLGDFIVVTAVMVCHNVFVHWALYTRRYDLFRGLLNLAIYLAEMSFVVSFTGALESEAYMLYILLIIGFGAYSRRFRQTILVAALCCVVYILVVAVNSYLSGADISVGVIIAKLLIMLVCGWLVGRVSEVLWNTEQGYLAQAQAVASSEATLRTILDSTADPILVYDEDEAITEANNKAEEFLGAPREKLLGLQIREFLFDDGTLPAKMEATYAAGELRGEQVLVSADGTERSVDFTVRSYVLHKKRYFVCVAHDITDRKHLLEVTRLTNENLERLNRQLRQVSQFKTDVLATLSQKLRSPLAAILGYVEMLLHEELGQTTHTQRRALRTCRRSAFRMFRLMDETLDSGTLDMPPIVAETPDRNRNAR